MVSKNILLEGLNRFKGPVTLRRIAPTYTDYEKFSQYVGVRRIS